MPATRRTCLIRGLHTATLATAATAHAWPLSAWAAKPTLRLGSLVPKHSPYHQQLLQLGEAWRKAEGDGARFAVFTDGSQGGEAEMVRRMRIGQLQGALMSVTGLREIEPSVAALQNLPLLFQSWDELDHVREQLRPDMERRFEQQGFVVVGWGDAGWVRFFSKAAAQSPDDYKGMKFFAWGSEAEQQAIMKELGYTPVPLETADILPAVQTGMVDVVPSTPYFALATQIYQTAGHMLQINWAPIVGALVVTRAAWDRMGEAGRTALRGAGAQAAQAMRQQARKEVDEAVAAMRERGLKVHQPDAKQLQQWRTLADKLYPRIRGSMVPAETFDAVMAHLKAYRQGKAK